MISKFIMLRLVLFLIVIYIFPIKSFSQEKVYTTRVTKLTFFNPGVSYEQPIGPKQTLYGQLFMNTSFSYSYSSSLGSDFLLYIDPASTLQYRYYYNGNKRVLKGKRTQMNSMNYVNAVFEANFSSRPFHTNPIETHRRFINSLGLAWGLQRNYPKRFSLDLYFGFGYVFAKSIY